MDWQARRMKGLESALTCLLLLLLLMEVELAEPGGPPRLTHVLVKEGDTVTRISNNRSAVYAPSSFDQLELQCESEGSEPINYFWNLNDIPLAKVDLEFNISEGHLQFLQPNYGMFECFASNEAGTSYAWVTLVKHVDPNNRLELLRAPAHRLVTPNSVAKFSCRVGGEQAHPPFEFAWSFNTKQVDPAWTVSTDGDTSSLLTGPLSSEGKGTVGCLVTSPSDSGLRLYQEGSLGLLPDPGDPMSPPEILNWQFSDDSVHLSSSGDLSLATGDSVDVICEVKNAQPSAAIAWYSPSGAITTNTLAGSEKLLQLKLDNVNKETATGSYSCVADNAAGSADRLLKVTVFDRSEVSISEETNSHHALLDQPFAITCAFTVDAEWGGNGVAVTWKKNGAEISQNDDDSNNIFIDTSISDGTSVLKLNTVSEKDEGNYSCHVSTPADNAAASWWRVQVVVPAQIVSFDPDKLVLEGGVTVLPCLAVGRPTPHVRWFHNDVELATHGPYLVTEDTGLRIEGAGRNLAGEYRCEADNTFGKDERVAVLSVAKPTKPILDGSQTTVVKNAGDHLELTCSARVDPLLRDAATFYWSQEGVREEPNPVAATTSAADNVMSATLTIAYLLGEDAGTYVCQVRTLLDAIRVETRVDVTTLPPRVSSALPRVGGIAGESVQMTCTGVGIPPPEVKFKFGGDEFVGQEKKSGGNLTTSNLLLRNLSPSMEGEYVCLGVNEYGNSQTSLYLSVYSSTIILQGPTDRVLESGETVTIPCKVKVDNRISDSLEISWLKDEKPLLDTVDRITINPESLTIEKLNKADEGLYSCVVQTAWDRTNATGRLTVLSESPSFISTPRDIRVLEGRTVDLACQATGVPLPQIEWSFGGRSLSSRRGVLNLPAVSSEKEGSYVCTASNLYGQIRESVQVQVIKGVRRENNQNLIPDIVKNVRDTISLPCDFKVDHRVEKETKIVWFKNSELVSLQPGKHEMIAANRSLTITNIELGDAGQYTCKVITPLQEVESSISLIVSGESPRILTSFDKVTIHEGETLTLDCLARGVPRPNIEWLLKDRPVSSQYLQQGEVANSEFQETKVVIATATKSHEGVYQCVARNNVGTVVKNSNVRVIRRTKVSITNEDGRSEMVISAGEKLKLPCRVDNDEMNRITKIAWSKNERNIQVGGEDKIDFGMDGSISIFNVQKRHEGTYKCTVTTVKDEESAELTLKVMVNAPVITRYSPNSLIFGGTTTALECSATGIPPPHITWTFNKTVTKVEGAMFDIKSAISTDAGHYTCTAKNSVGETQRTITVGVVTVPNMESTYQSKRGSTVKLPCILQSEEINVLWLKDGQPLDGLAGDPVGVEPPTVDRDGYLVIRNLSESDEGEYRCRVSMESGRLERLTTVKIMPDIVTLGNTRMEVREGEDFTLKCDVLPGVNAKRMWKKDGHLVFPESGSGLDILKQGGVLSVDTARPQHSGEWECVATTAWGQDSILYWVTVPSSRPTRKPCTRRDPPVITHIASISNTSLVMEWEVFNFNASCYEEFSIFWWTKEADSTHDHQTAELSHRKATVHGLRPGVSYFFQVNLVRDRDLRDYMYGQTKSHVMEFVEDPAVLGSSSPKAVIIVVILVLVLLGCLLALLYVKRSAVSEYLTEHGVPVGRGAKSGKNLEFTEFSSRLVANPDFMASLAPQWPEPEPEPTEERAFIPQQRPLSSRRNSKTSITSSWSSLFNVVSNENLSSVEQEAATYRRRTRKE